MDQRCDDEYMMLLRANSLIDKRYNKDRKRTRRAREHVL